MKIKHIVDEDFVNYKKPSMFIIFPHCSFKCEKEAKTHCCQNSELAQIPNYSISEEEILQRYLSNPITQAIVCGGLEPLDSLKELTSFLYNFRSKCTDDIVIYTGYTKKECEQNGWLKTLSAIPNIIVKFGRYIPHSTSHHDELLGITLSSEGQYAEKIS